MPTGTNIVIEPTFEGHFWQIRESLIPTNIIGYLQAGALPVADVIISDDNPNYWLTIYYTECTCCFKRNMASSTLEYQTAVTIKYGIAPVQLIPDTSEVRILATNFIPVYFATTNNELITTANYEAACTGNMRF